MFLNRVPTCRPALLALGLLVGWAGAASGQQATGSDALRARLIEVAESVVYPERCGECHEAEFEVWEQTPHATGFDTLHTTDRAKEVYQALGIRLIKRGTEEETPACLGCHYTPEVRRGTVRAAAGVTCESCHGPARDWVDVHNNYGVAESDFQRAALLETPEHRVQRIADSRAAGMRRPSDLYDVAANCFGCHTVPNETLVNVAGHTTGSDFELVDWSGQIRHNFLESFKTGDGRTNAERSPERKRVMYVVGRALDLEYSLRGVAAATDDRLYFAAMSDRAGAAIDELYYLNEIVSIPAVQAIIERFDDVELKPNNGPALLAAADAIQAATRDFIADTDPTTLGALDPLWNPDLEPPRIAPPPAATLTQVTDLPATPPSAGAPGPAVADPPAAPVADEPVAEPRRAPPPVARAVSDPPSAAPTPRYDVFTRPPWRAPPDHAYVKVPCGNCHTQQQAWWQQDTHKDTADPLRNGEPEAVEIATRYGIDPANMARGDQTCMWCHGTIVATPSRKVRPGVSCQRCHGAGADYLAPHETVGYQASVALGLTPLKTAEVRAATCAGCHYITDPGLLAAGHATGEDFDIVARLEDIRHWGTDFGRETNDPVTPADLAVAHGRVIAERGPPPDVVPTPSVEVATARRATPSALPVTEAALPAAVATPVETPGAGTLAPPPTGAAVPAPPSQRPAATASPRARPQPVRTRVASRRPVEVADPELDGAGLDGNASPEEMLLELKARLEAVYRALGRAQTP